MSKIAIFDLCKLGSHVTHGGHLGYRDFDDSTDFVYVIMVIGPV